MAAGAKFITRDFSGDDNRRYVNMLLDELAQQAAAQQAAAQKGNN
jgi:transcription termination factor NusB